MITMSANGISDLSTKQLKQEAKLDIAKAKREGRVVADDGSVTGSIDSAKNYYRARNNYSRDLLPTKYTVDAITNNANTIDGVSGTLVPGRPWTSDGQVYYNDQILDVSPGIFRTNYQGYHSESIAFFNTAALKTGDYAYNAADDTINEPSLPNSTSMMLKGYFKTTYTGNHTFYLNSDDGAYMWIGANAPTAFTIGNATISNGGLHAVTELSAVVSLTAGEYVPIRIMFGNGPAGPGVLQASFQWSGQSKSDNWSGKIFYNTLTNGF